jgi:glutathione-regulated potassium-efflux system ancillary protein KefC
MEVLWILAAYILGLAAKRMGLPPLVGYLLAGFGLSAMGKEASPAIHDIAHFGVLLMLFMVGLKLRLKNLLQKEVLGAGGLHLLLFGAIAVATVGLLADGRQPAILLGLGLAFSSTVLAVKQLEDRRELAVYHGRISVGILVLQDLAAVALMAVAGRGAPSPWALLLLGVFLLRPVLIWTLRKSGYDEVLLLFGVAMAVGGGLLAESLGLSGELGALVAGAVLAGDHHTEDLSEILWSAKELFLVAFFFEVGLAGLPTLDQWPLVATTLVLLPIKAVVFFALLVLFGLRARTAFVTSVSLTSYSEFALILLAVVIQRNLVPAAWEPAIGLAVALSLVIAAPLNRSVHAVYQRFEPYLVRFERSGFHPDVEPTDLGDANWLVVGMGRTGGAVYKMLERQGQKVVGIEADPNKVERHRRKGRQVIFGDSEDPELWGKLNLSGLEGVLLTMPDLPGKIFALKGLARRQFEGIRAATSYHLEEEPELHAAGATMIFRPFAEAGERLAERALEERMARVAEPEPAV